MRTSRRRPGTTFVVAVVLVAGSACGFRGARPHAPGSAAAGESAARRTRTASDSRVEPGHDNERFARIEDLIEGRAPGVRVIRGQNGSFRLQIRGVSSPSGRNDPLVVIDGSPTSEFRPGSALASLNPADVVQIDVLKDAASTAFYGMRGANGVIVITTRHQ